MKYQKAVGTIVVPFWPSAHCWPLITNKYHKYVTASSFHIGSQSLMNGRNFNSLLGYKHFKGYVVAIRIEFIDKLSVLLVLVRATCFAEPRHRSSYGAYNSSVRLKVMATTVLFIALSRRWPYLRGATMCFLTLQALACGSC